jgi:hypothetical protein
MSAPGGNDLMVAARRVLLDALAALTDQRDALVLIGAQAIYLHTGAAHVALPELTNDSDLTIDRRQLPDDPVVLVVVLVVVDCSIHPAATTPVRDRPP